MNEIHDIKTSLLDHDGSCRDVNFERPSWDGVSAMLNHLAQSFKNCSMADHDGHTINQPLAEDVFSSADSGGYAHLSLSGGKHLIKHLQAFISAEDDGSPFVELAFFPKDVTCRCPFVATAVAEKISAMERDDYLAKRAARASRKKFEEALAQIPDREPDEHDRF